MSVLVDNNTRVVVQGITGKEGSFHARQCIAYGTQVVAGVTPGKGGQKMDEVPVFNTVKDAVAQAGANTSLIFVPPAFAADAILEAAERRHQSHCLHHRRHSHPGDGQSGPAVGRHGHPPYRPELSRHNFSGKAKVGIMPGPIHEEGPVAVVSRSGTLTYEAVYQLTLRGLGQSTCVGIGGDPIIGTNFIDMLKLLPGRPANPGDCSHRRDRRHRRRRGRGLYQSTCYQTRGVFYRRHDRAPGQTHGSRRRHYFRRQRQSRG